MGREDNILCTKSHEYLMNNTDGTYTVGLTDYAVEQLGDIVFVELPEVDSEFKKGESFGAIESVKAASEIYMPVSGVIKEVNEPLVDAPELLNEDIYDKGWLVKIQLTGANDELDDLMDYSDYREEVGQ
jgi:glycine cleavage system H protein